MDMTSTTGRTQVNAELCMAQAIADAIRHPGRPQNNFINFRSTSDALE